MEFVTIVGRQAALRRLCGFLVATVVFAFLTGSSNVHAQAGAGGADSDGAPLRVVTKDIEPFVFVGDELSGFSIDLWKELARAAGLEYEFEIVDSVTEQLDAVEGGSADAGIAAISVTQARGDGGLLVLLF